MASYKKLSGAVSAAINDESPVYHIDFEPYCEWKRGHDLFILHVPEFKKEHLEVQVNPSGALKISGERPLRHVTSSGEDNDSVISKQRFHKEIRVHPESCNINDIQAKLSNGKLTITFPRRQSLTSLLPLPTRQDQGPVIQEQKTGGGDGGGCSVLEMVLGKCGVEEEDDEKLGFGRFKVSKKIVVMGVGVAVVAAAIGVLVVLKPDSFDEV
ncbi:hypothetical protein V2J09_018625 [Rumex salicifolius]